MAKTTVAIARRILGLLVVALACVAVAVANLSVLAAAKDVRVVGVEVRGLKYVSSERVSAVTKTRVGDVLAEDKLEKRVRDEDLMAISKMGLFADQAVRLVSTRDGVKVVYELVENPKLRAIGFKGNTILSENTLLSLMALKPGQLLDTNALRSDLEAILKYHAGKGAVVRIADITVDKDDRLKITIAERRIEKIVLEGNSKTRANIILRELTSKEGDLVDYGKIRAEQRRILNLGFFQEITPILEKGSTEDLAVYRLSLKERKTGGAAGGLGYSGKDGLLGYLEVSERNMFGKGQTLSVKFELGSKGSRTYELGFVEPWVADGRTSVGSAIYQRQVVRKEPMEVGPTPLLYTESRTGGDVTLTHLLGNEGKLSLKLKAELTRTTDSQGPALPLDGDGMTHSIAIGYSQDLRDSFINPRTGYQLRASAEVAGGLLGGDNSFDKLMAAGSTYIGLRPNHTLALRLTLGKIFYGGSLPVQETFRLGGADSIRGYDYGALHGDTMAYANVEYRFPIAQPVSGVAFIDVGDAWYGAMAGPTLRLGIGLGLRADTPLGLVGLDCGVGHLDSAPKARITFSMGQIF